MNDSYEPIDCSVHDRLEDLAVRRRNCRVRYRTEEGAPGRAEGRIVDVFARDGEEFIRLDGGELIRLDRLIDVSAEDTP